MTVFMYACMYLLMLIIYYLIADLTELKAFFHDLLYVMPDDYVRTIGKLKNYFTDDQIYAVLSSDNSTKANKIIMNCLIEGISCKEELLDVYDQMESICGSEWKSVINKRFG